MIPGSGKLISVFGSWPSFHDAEVVWLQLDRRNHERCLGPSLSLLVHLFAMTGEVKPSGSYVQRNHVLVLFRFAQVVEVYLENFNHQNVLWELSIKDIRDRQMEGISFEVQLSTSFGLEGSFQCSNAEVLEVDPCDPKGNPL